MMFTVVINGAFWGVRGVLGCEDAADLLGMSLSSFYRWRGRYEAEGAAGLADARLGRVSKRRAPVDEVKEHGLFGSLYADRGSHYWTTLRTGKKGAGKVDKDHPTQVGGALNQLGIELIAAYSPEA